MLVLTTPAQMLEYARAVKAKGVKIVFVPTMGFLHEGHASLMRLGKKRCPGGDLVVSIFVNPAQFGPNEDLARYPRDLTRDRALCEREGAEVLFLPTAGAIYPPGFDTFIEPGKIATLFEGAIRPGHFRGVCTVVNKLFNLVQPDLAVFGRKDAQQVAVLKQMVRDLAIPVELLVGPTMREPDGLALSSRNVYLNPEERAQALALNDALREARALIAGGEPRGDAIRRRMAEIVGRQPLARLDYADVVDAASFRTLDTLTGDCLLLLAAKFGPTRLIDNEPVSIP